MGMGKDYDHVGDMCSSKEVKAAFNAPPSAGKDVEAAGRVARVGGAKEIGVPPKGAGGPGPAKG